MVKKISTSTAITLKSNDGAICQDMIFLLLFKSLKYISFFVYVNLFTYSKHLYFDSNYYILKEIISIQDVFLIKI